MADASADRKTSSDISPIHQGSVEMRVDVNAERDETALDRSPRELFLRIVLGTSLLAVAGGSFLMACIYWAMSFAYGGSARGTIISYACLGAAGLWGGRAILFPTPLKKRNWTAKNPFIRGIIESRMFALLQMVRPQLSEWAAVETQDLIQAREPGVALELICDDLFEFDKSVPNGVYDEIARVGHKMRLSSARWERLSRR